MHILPASTPRRRSLIAFAILVASSLHAASAPSEISAGNVLRLMNLYREEAGLPPLRNEPRLTRAADDRMRHMEDEGYWSHESPSGLSPFAWVSMRAYRFSYAGENLAAGFETAPLLVHSWMESRGHRDNILSPHFTDCGIAIIDGGTVRPLSGKSIVVLFASE